MQLRPFLKQSAGRLIKVAYPRLSYDKCIFVLAHMRCGSTALSNILCSRPKISGYGETHVKYDGEGALGRLALNQMRQGCKPLRADSLFDKILHTRLDQSAPASFYNARAIFVVREPEPTIRSIVKLYRDIGRCEYDTQELAAEYYIERLNTLADRWDNFKPEQRVGMTHAGLLHDPDGVLGSISEHFRFAAPLENIYISPAASRRGGGGDPLVSGKHNRIEPALLRPAKSVTTLDISSELAAEAMRAHAAMVERISAQWPRLSR